MTVCALCNHNVTHPCPTVEHADACSCPALERRRLPPGTPGNPIRTTLGNLLGSSPAGIAAIERGMAEAQAEREAASADMESQRQRVTARFTPTVHVQATLAPEPPQAPLPPEGLTINWDAVQPEPRMHDCEMCGERVSSPCRSLNSARGCTLPALVFREQYRDLIAPRENARRMPPAVREIARNASSLGAHLLAEVEDQERRAAATGFTVCGPDGVLDVNSVTTTAHTTMVTFLVSCRGYDAPPLVNDLDTTLDAWNSGPLLEGFSVVRVQVALVSTAPATPAWQPMRDAPRDGRRILMTPVGRADNVPLIARWCADPHGVERWYNDDARGNPCWTSYSVRHMEDGWRWMPLPTMDQGAPETREPAPPEPPQEVRPRRRAIRA